MLILFIVLIFYTLPPTNIIGSSQSALKTDGTSPGTTQKSVTTTRSMTHNSGKTSSTKVEPSSEEMKEPTLAAKEGITFNF